MHRTREPNLPALLLNRCEELGFTLEACFRSTSYIHADSRRTQVVSSGCLPLSPCFALQHARVFSHAALTRMTSSRSHRWGKVGRKSQLERTSPTRVLPNTAKAAGICCESQRGSHRKGKKMSPGPELRDLLGLTGIADL